MLVTEYAAFVKASDQFTDRDASVRQDIAIYGLVGEIGSLLSAIKKQLLAEGGRESWDYPNEEIVEELGDLVWYCFSLAQIANHSPVNIFTINIALLKHDMSATDEESKKLQAALDRTKKDEFLDAAATFPNTAKMQFRDYQSLAFLTARTAGKVLLEVCLSVLWQLGAELMRTKLPSGERELNKSMPDREINTILGEIGWHIAAIASIYRISLDDIAYLNREKVSFRQNRGAPTPLHDEDSALADNERFPRKFDIAFITIGEGRSRMYMNGVPLGDDLTDNSHTDDGYRFHDVMHLANIAILGWSPVLRGLMGRKRKSKPKIDEVEDGARAKLIEELIVKGIHSEGVRLATERDAAAKGIDQRLFPTKGDVPFKLLKSTQHLTEGLEVSSNKAWEWEEVIVSGCDAYYQLRKEGQGTIAVDLDARTLTFSSDVDIDLRGSVAGIGSALTRCAGDAPLPSDNQELTLCVKRAVLDSIGLPPEALNLDMLNVRFDNHGRPLIRARGGVQEELWRRKIISFRVTASTVDNMIASTSVAMSDSRDAKR